MMSMLRWCQATQPQRTMHLYYGLRNSREHAFKPLLEEIAASHPALRLNVVYSRPADTDTKDHDYQHEGHVDIELLRRTLPHGRHQFYVCGPPAMMQTLVPALASWACPLATSITKHSARPLCACQVRPKWRLQMVWPSR